MTLTRAEFDRWDAGAVRRVFLAATQRAESAEAAAARLADLPAFPAWEGVAAGAAREALSRTREELLSLAEEARAVARAAAHAAEAIARLKDDLRGLEEAAGAHLDHPTGEMTARLGGILAEATSVDGELAQAIWLAEGRLPVPRSPQTPPAPPGGSPQAVNRWWAGLTDAERTALLADDPEHFGNLDGIPASDRDIANRRVLAEDLREATGTSMTRYRNAFRIAEALGTHAIRTGADITLLTYQPVRFGGQGRAAVAIGDPDSAAHTTVLVPGTGNSVASGWLSTSDAANLFNETAAATGDQSAAVVAWMGYDAPDSMLDPRVARPDLARAGAALLAADVNALSVTSHTRSPVTVVGHSYGSTTVADAAAGYGMRAGDVVLVGSPGTDMARTAADFHLREGGHVYVGSASSDPVAMLSGLAVGLGADPAADGFGSTRFKAEVPGVTWQTWTDHGRYFASGSESLYSIADVAAGDGAALQDHRMTAPHRRSLLGPLGTQLGLPNWSGPLADPELPRPGTSGHFHTGIGR